VPDTLALLQEILSERWVLRELNVPARTPGLEEELKRSAQVLSRKHAAGRILYRLRLTPENWERLHKKISGMLN
jgi:hypothetical protein